LEESDILGNNRKINIEEGLEVIRLESIDKGENEILVDRNSIVFIYSPEKQCGLEWIDHKESHVLEPVQILVYTYPLKETAFKISQSENSTVYLLKISIGRLHKFFGSNFGSNPDEIQSFVGSFRIKSIYSEKAVNPAVSVIFHQIFNHGLEGPLKQLFLQGKLMEFLSYYLQRPKTDEKLSLQCPFVNNHLEMEKIKEARDLIVKDLVDPPNLKDLARMVGTNEFKLKVGFKSMFGNTVYGYLNSYRMEKARHLLEEREHSVKEVSLIIGYSNPSHFISAYKKNFGITPKKHLMSLH
jgi:AraC-like DNA-binding protein